VQPGAGHIFISLSRTFSASNTTTLVHQSTLINELSGRVFCAFFFFHHINTVLYPGILFNTIYYCTRLVLVTVTPMKRLPRNKWERRRKGRVMVGTRSTPTLHRWLPAASARNSAANVDTAAVAAAGDAANAAAPASPPGGVTMPGDDAQAVLDEMLQQDGGAHLPGVHTSVPSFLSSSSSLRQLPKHIRHDVDELKFYLETIQSGVKPAPVQLPTTSWPRGVEVPPSTVSSMASMQSTMLPWGGSTVSAQERINHSQWMFSPENPAVVRIRGPGDYTFDAAAQDTASVNSDNVVRVTIDTTSNGGVHNSGGKHPTNHSNMALDSRARAFNNVFMPPEQNPVAERRKFKHAEERKLLRQLRAQGHLVRSHLEKLSEHGPHGQGTMRVADLKDELTALLCTQNNTMSQKDIDRLLFALPADKLDSMGRVHVGRLLGTARLAGRGSPGSVIPIRVSRSPASHGHDSVDDVDGVSSLDGCMMPQRRAVRVNNRPYLDTGASFERVIVPNSLSALFAPATTTYVRGAGRDVPLEQAQDKWLREKKREGVGQRQMERSVKWVERKSREEEELALKDSARLEHKRGVAARYSAFLEKETIRRMKMGNKFALKMFLEDPPLRLDHRRHQYKQYIDDGTRDRQLAAYNQKMSKVPKTEWHRIFR
jgi:hypothetical protein